MELFEPDSLSVKLTAVGKWAKTLRILDPVFRDPGMILGIFIQVFGGAKGRSEADVKRGYKRNKPATDINDVTFGRSWVQNFGQDLGSRESWLGFWQISGCQQVPCPFFASLVR